MPWTTLYLNPLRAAAGYILWNKTSLKDVFSFLGPKNINSEIKKIPKNLIVVVSARNLDMLQINMLAFN
jgi:hypothetical protein